MSREKLNIEQLFKQKFEHFEVQPSEKVWKRVNSSLLRRNFMKFTLDSFNIYYLSAIIIAGTLAVLSVTREKTLVNEPFSVIQNGIESTANEIQDIQNRTEPGTIPPKTNNGIAVQKNTNEKDLIPGPEKQQVQNFPVNRIVNTVKNLQEGQQKTDMFNPPYIPDQVPLSYFSVSKREGCAPLKVNFINQSENGSGYSWSFGDGGYSTEKSPSYIFDEPGTYFVTLSVITDGHEITAFTDSIHVYPLPDIHFNLDSDIVPGTGQPVYFYNYSKGADYFEWKFGDGNTSIQKEPFHYYEKSGNYDITLKAESVYGCRDSVVLKNAFAENTPVILFPNAFSPNRNGPSDGYYSPNDSRNDVFHPVFKDLVEDYQLRIFNRKGMLLFESNDMNIGWDGYYHQTLMPQGVYVWKVRGRFANGRSFVKMGDVTLIWTR